MKIFVITAISIALLSACKRGRPELQINDVKPIDIPGDSMDVEEENNSFSWDGSSDLALGGLFISSK